MVTLQEFFYQPTVKEITTGREPYSGPISKRDLVKIIEGLSPRQFLEIPPDLEISPYPDRSVNYSRKHGRLVRMRVYDSQAQAEEDQCFPFRQREEAISSLGVALQESPEGFIYPVGLAYGGLGQDRNLMVIQLTGGIDGVRYYGFSERLASDKEKVKIHDYDPKSRVASEGAGYFCEVASRTTGDKLPAFIIKGVPVVDNTRKWSLAYCITHSHSCGYTSNLRLFFEDPRTGIKDVRPLDEHFVAAYLKIIDIEQEKLDRKKKAALAPREQFTREPCVPLDMSLVALPTQKTIDYDAKVMFQVVKWDYRREKGRVKNYRRPVFELEREILHWNRAAQQPVKTTFYIEEKVRNLKIPFFQQAA